MLIKVLTAYLYYVTGKTQTIHNIRLLFPLREKHCVRFHPGEISVVNRARTLTYPLHYFDFCSLRDYLTFWFLNIRIQLSSSYCQHYRVHQIKKNPTHFSSNDLVNTLSFEAQEFFKIHFSSKIEYDDCGLHDHIEGQDHLHSQSYRLLALRHLVQRVIL